MKKILLSNPKKLTELLQDYGFMYSESQLSRILPLLETKTVKKYSTRLESILIDLDKEILKMATKASLKRKTSP